MIDFRYHVVSLISVFLALAVGIALGAGPLKETIGDTLTGQVDQLRSEKDELRSQLDDSQRSLSDTRAFVDASAPQLLDGALADRRVAVVSLGEVGQDELTAIDERLVQAGAEVTAHATLTDAWFDPDLRSFRQALAGSLVTFLEPVPADGATLDAQLAQALIQGLTGADPASPDKLTSAASDVLDILSGGDNPLVSLTDKVERGADAIVVLAAPAAASGDDGTTPTATPAPATVDAELAVLAAAQEFSTGAVLADGPRGPQSLVDVVLGDDALASRITTVSGADEVTGQVTVPLALASSIAQAVGHYGFGPDETVLPEPVELAPVDRTPRIPETEQTPPGQEPTSTPTAQAGG